MLFLVSMRKEHYHYGKKSEFDWNEKNRSSSNNKLVIYTKE